MKRQQQIFHARQRILDCVVRQAARLIGAHPGDARLRKAPAAARRELVAQRFACGFRGRVSAKPFSGCSTKIVEGYRTLGGATPDALFCTACTSSANAST